MKKCVYAGLALVSFSTLMFEILLTRIFSVTIWYHFAFMALSIAMFGMTVGALLVYWFPGYFNFKQVERQLVLSSLLFAVSIVIGFLAHLKIPFITSEKLSIVIPSMTLTYAAIAVPFVFSGICTCLALTKFPKYVSRIYASDLVGAALGCIALIFILKIVDGPTAVIVTAVFASLGSVFFAVGLNNKTLMRVAVIISLLLMSFSAANAALRHNGHPLLKIRWVKGADDTKKYIYDKWNSFSRVSVYGPYDKPFGWALSRVYNSENKIKQLWLVIDSSASTPMTAFDGDLSKIEYLKWDITNLAHYIKSDAKVLIVGTGGGRDVLSALVFGQKSILGIDQ